MFVIFLFLSIYTFLNLIWICFSSIVIVIAYLGQRLDAAFRHSTMHLLVVE
jgi:hypothetical protein